MAVLLQALGIRRTSLKRLRPKCQCTRAMMDRSEGPGGRTAHLARAQPHCSAARHTKCPEWVILREIYSAPLKWTKNHTRRCYLEQRDATKILNMTRNSDSQTIQTIYGTINRRMSQKNLKYHRDHKIRTLWSIRLNFQPRTPHGTWHCAALKRPSPVCNVTTLWCWRYILTIICN